MKEMLIAQGITILIMLLGFIGNAIYFKGVFTTKLNEHEEDIKSLKSSVRYKDTCDAMFEGHDHRIEALETIRNKK